MREKRVSIAFPRRSGPWQRLSFCSHRACRPGGERALWWGACARSPQRGYPHSRLSGPRGCLPGRGLGGGAGREWDYKTGWGGSVSGGLTCQSGGALGSGWGRPGARAGMLRTGGQLEAGRDTDAALMGWGITWRLVGSQELGRGWGVSRGRSPSRCWGQSSRACCQRWGGDWGLGNKSVAWNRRHARVGFRSPK